MQQPTPAACNHGVSTRDWQTDRLTWLVQRILHMAISPHMMATLCSHRTGLQSDESRGMTIGVDQSPVFAILDRALQNALYQRTQKRGSRHKAGGPWHKGEAPDTRDMAGEQPTKVCLPSCVCSASAPCAYLHVCAWSEYRLPTLVV